MLSEFSPGRIATLASLLEVSAPKPGNVHRSADFEDVTFVDFVASATSLGHSIDKNIDAPLGPLILAATRDSIQIAGSNTNLGIILLVCPLAKALTGQQSTNLQAKVQSVLNQLDQSDCRDVYEAIRIARPGGLGSSTRMDVSSPPPKDLLTAMRHASDHDLVARQFANGFDEVFHLVAPMLVDSRSYCNNLSEAVVLTHVRLLSQIPDSLIARKCGTAIANQASAMATSAINAFDFDNGPVQQHQAYWECVASLDFWLRSDGNRRNPGTTADLIAAGLFVALATGKLVPPF